VWLHPGLVEMSVVVAFDSVNIPWSTGLVVVSVEHHSYHSTTKNTRCMSVNAWNSLFYVFQVGMVANSVP